MNSTLRSFPISHFIPLGHWGHCLVALCPTAVVDKHSMSRPLVFDVHLNNVRFLNIDRLLIFPALPEATLSILPVNQGIFYHHITTIISMTGRPYVIVQCGLTVPLSNRSRWHICNYSHLPPHLNSLEGHPNLGKLQIYM